MTLRVLNSVDEACAWLAARGATALTSDNRRLRPGEAFIAWPGHVYDGRGFVASALAAGAAACLVEADGVQAFGFDQNDERIAAWHGLKAATGLIADAWFDQPSERLDVVAVTGTNGKTSTAWWTAQALTALGRRCGFIGTLGTGEPPLNGRPMSVAATGLTTPDAITFHAVMRRFADDGFAACGIEASSIGLVEQRLAGARIAVGVFTNFTRDHLDYHGTMTSYWAAKELLFSAPGLRAAAVNIDDAQGSALAQSLSGRRLDVWTVSMRSPARLRAVNVHYADGGLAFDLVEGAHALAVRTQLIGEYNVSNLLGVFGALRALGLPLADAVAVASRLTPVPGRMQRLSSGAEAPEVVVDYAHTPDALEQALRALRPLAVARGGELWCVFGCGGNRDVTKRPLMGALAQRLAAHAIVTSDNPRLEDPAQILAHITSGMVNGLAPRVIEDRRAAIGYAVKSAGAQDVVLVAGKGHEDYQEVDGRKLPFSDVDEASAALAQRRREELAA